MLLYSRIFWLIGPQLVAIFGTFVAIAFLATQLGTEHPTSVTPAADSVQAVSEAVPPAGDVQNAAPPESNVLTEVQPTEAPPEQAPEPEPDKPVVEAGAGSANTWIEMPPT